MGSGGRKPPGYGRVRGASPPRGYRSLRSGPPRFLLVFLFLFLLLLSAFLFFALSPFILFLFLSPPFFISSPPLPRRNGNLQDATYNFLHGFPTAAPASRRHGTLTDEMCALYPNATSDRVPASSQGVLRATHRGLKMQNQTSSRLRPHHHVSSVLLRLAPVRVEDLVLRRVEHVRLHLVLVASLPLELNVMIHVPSAPGTQLYSQWPCHPLWLLPLQKLTSCVSLFRWISLFQPMHHHS